MEKDIKPKNFLEIIEMTKKFAWEEQTAFWPEETPENADHLTVQISQVCAKMSELSLSIQNKGHTFEKQEEFIKLENKKLELMKEKVQSRIELCMKHQLDNVHERKTENLFKWTKNYLSRDGFLEKMVRNKSDLEINKLLDKCDETFTNKNNDYKPNLEAYKQIKPDRKYNVDAWNPVGDCDKVLEDYIRKKKKIDPFYKNHADSLANPTFILLKLIETADYFPELLRYSKVTMLPSRFIFSLDALPKIIESILALEVNNCILEDYKKHGDPHQMAYEPNRGTTACNAITFTHVDLNLAAGKSCAQAFVDVQKALNVMNRELMLNLVQKIAGAGRLVATRFLNRVYIDPFGRKRGQNHNRGVDAGCAIPVCCFKLGINSDVSLTALNKDIDWASLYSDDRSPLCSCPLVMQKAFDESLDWARKNQISYHDGVSCCLDSDGVSKCKKFPSILIFKTNKSSNFDGFEDIMLGDIPFKVAESQRILGLNVFTAAEKPAQTKVLKERGYYFIPEINRIKSLAYRLQDIKNDFLPPISSYHDSLLFCRYYE